MILDEMIAISQQPIERPKIMHSIDCIFKIIKKTDLTFDGAHTIIATLFNKEGDALRLMDDKFRFITDYALEFL